MSSSLPYSPVTFTTRAVYAIAEAPLHARIDRISVVYNPSRFSVDPEARIIKVKDDSDRELTYSITEETDNAFLCTMICDYRPELDEADFIDKEEDACTCEACTPVDAGDTDADADEDTLEFLAPGTVTVSLVGDEHLETITVSDVIVLQDAGDRLLLGLSDGRMTVISHPFYGYTVDDPGMTGNFDVDAVEATEQASPAEPELDREGLERLRAQAAQEKAQREAVQQVLTINPMDVLDGLIGALVVSLATNR